MILNTTSTYPPPTSPPHLSTTAPSSTYTPPPSPSTATLSPISTPQTTQQQLSSTDSPTLTITFGILGILLALAGLLVAALQLRHMYRRRKTSAVPHELCASHTRSSYAHDVEEARISPTHGSCAQDMYNSRTSVLGRSMDVCKDGPPDYQYAVGEGR